MYSFENDMHGPKHLGLSKEASELLAFRFKEKLLLEEGPRITF